MMKKMMMMKKGGKAKKKWPKYEEELKNAGFDFEVEWTKGRHDATEIAKKAIFKIENWFFN